MPTPSFSLEIQAYCALSRASAHLLILVVESLSAEGANAVFYGIGVIAIIKNSQKVRGRDVTARLKHSSNMYCISRGSLWTSPSLEIKSSHKYFKKVFLAV